MYVGKTSPPFAREAAMSAIKHETFLKHLESFLETSLKHSGNTLENNETPLKHPSNKKCTVGGGGGTEKYTRYN